MKTIRWLSLVVVLLMLTPLFSTAALANSTMEGMPEELTIFSALNSWLARAGNDMHASEAYNEIERVTGTKINWIHPPAGTGEAEQFNLMIVSGDLPDIISYRWMNIPGGVQKYIDDGIIVDMTPYYDDGKMPNLKKLFEEFPIASKQIRQDDGSIYYTTGVRRNDELRIWVGPQIRVDWLEQVGMDIPDTVDDLYNVLKAFKDQGVSDDPNFVPMTATKFRDDYTFGLGIMCYPFGAAAEFMTDPTGTVVGYGPLEPEFKEAIAFIRKLVEDELLDVNYVTNVRDDVDAMIVTGQAGFMHNTQVTKLALLFEEQGIDNPFKPIPYFRGPNPTGELATVYFPEAGANIMNNCLAVTTQAKDIEAAIRWVDFQYSDLGAEIRNFGIEGVSFTREGDERVLTDLVLQHPEWDVNTATAVYTPAKVGVFTGIQLWESWKQSNHPDGVDCVYKYLSRVDQSQIMPPTSMTGEEQAEYATIMADIETYFDETIDRIILGQLPLEHLDTMVNQMYSMGIERAIELKQAALDRYNQR